MGRHGRSEEPVSAAPSEPYEALLALLNKKNRVYGERLRDDLRKLFA